ncbi:hypothetical protein VCR12J2_630158 [Vibrio coralliirubri]|nr:hypothetical protein VCR6J2_240052 [Vibrio coralliirubri]CDT43541.1 hypothetical protein VCR1J2_580019 [Vibrio coralliirubri]CDT98693.1 hypothetical protein VCR8J2_590020 [Vibrio coralliirubri]CDU03556.1 hypothetical protein VCR12J2_630158 [Vibrio coralliirubri]
MMALSRCPCSNSAGVLTSTTNAPFSINSHPVLARSEAWTPELSSAIHNVESESKVFIVYSLNWRVDWGRDIDVYCPKPKKPATQ